MSAFTKRSPQKYTIESYLALDEKSEEKYEYANGVIWAMSGGTRNHSKIAVNLAVALQNAFRAKGRKV